jgi:ferredoxin--NADP+ reductase
MLLPEDPTTDIIMVATGTGVAPFRAFLHRLFMEQTVARHAFTGEAWLILGVPVTSGLLYPQEFAAMQEQLEGSKNSAAKLTIDYAISREMTNAQGGKLYVQDVLAEQSDRLLEKLENGAVIYFCGLKGMMPGILESLEKVCASRGMNFSEKMKEYKDRHQWHVEVY